MVVTGALLVLTLLSGLWLSAAGKPYKFTIFTVHKLIALGTAIATALTVDQLRTGVDVTAVTLGILLLTGLLFLTLFISGALLSVGKPDHIAIRTMHRVAPILVTISAAATAYLLANPLAAP